MNHLTDTPNLLGIQVSLHFQKLVSVASADLFVLSWADLIFSVTSHRQCIDNGQEEI